MNDNTETRDTILNSPNVTNPINQQISSESNQTGRNVTSPSGQDGASGGGSSKQFNWQPLLTALAIGIPILSLVWFLFTLYLQQDDIIDGIDDISSDITGISKDIDQDLNVIESELDHIADDINRLDSNVKDLERTIRNSK